MVKWFAQILAAVRAKSVRIGRADQAIGQGKKHLLAHHVLKHKSALFIIPDFCLCFRKCAFSANSIDTGGAEDQVEISLVLLFGGVGTAGAEEFETGGVVAPEPDVLDDLRAFPVFFNEFGAAFNVQ